MMAPARRARPPAPAEEEPYYSRPPLPPPTPEEWERIRRYQDGQTARDLRLLRVWRLLGLDVAAMPRCPTDGLVREYERLAALQP